MIASNLGPIRKYFFWRSISKAIALCKDARTGFPDFTFFTYNQGQYFPNFPLTWGAHNRIPGVQWELPQSPRRW